jgi:hypothetical protein
MQASHLTVDVEVRLEARQDLIGQAAVGLG